MIFRDNGAARGSAAKAGAGKAAAPADQKEQNAGAQPPSAPTAAPGLKMNKLRISQLTFNDMLDNMTQKATGTFFKNLPLFISTINTCQEDYPIKKSELQALMKAQYSAAGLTLEQLAKDPRKSHLVR